MKRFQSFEAVEHDGALMGLDDLVATANEVLPGYLPCVTGPDEGVNRRLVRHLTTLGLIDLPGREGREARYSAHHLLQLLVVRRLQAEGHTTGALKTLTVGLGDDTLRALLHQGSSLLSRQQLQVPAAADLAADFAVESRIGHALESLLPEPQASVSVPFPQTRNAALEFLESIRVGTPQSSRAARAPMLNPPPEAAPLRWVRVEIEPGLELHLREDFRAPPTPHQRDELLKRISEKMKTVVPNKSPRRSP